MQNDAQKLKDVYLKFIEIDAFLFLPASIFVFLLSKEIILIMLGENWLSTVLPLKILSLSLFFRVGIS